jgi:hypothetical protein
MKTGVERVDGLDFARHHRRPRSGPVLREDAADTAYIIDVLDDVPDVCGIDDEDVDIAEEIDERFWPEYMTHRCLVKKTGELIVV